MIIPLFLALSVFQLIALWVVVLVLGKKLADQKSDVSSEVSRQVLSMREDLSLQFRHNREELQTSLRALEGSLSSRLTDLLTIQKNQLDSFSNHLVALTQSNEKKLELMRVTIEEKLRLLQEDNQKKLEQMRQTVDEKLHATLEKRLGESFKVVSDRLELVHKGLGEMQTLAAGVGDLKKVLSNVKTRGIWGEMQLAMILEQILSPEQYGKNVKTKANSNDHVEFAVRFPGKGLGQAEDVWLPIDSKFPQDVYQNILSAQEQGNPDLVEEMSKLLDQRIKQEAKDIQQKYLDPPRTTDFGLLFLPIEGLYAEVLRRPGLVEMIQHEYRVVLVGPTTLAALLNSLQMGFRTLAIEKRSSEVWTTLGVVKTEFGKFGDLLEKTHKKLIEAGNTIEDAARKSRTIERKLKTVQELPIESELPPLGRTNLEELPFSEEIS